jgi:hypothetical protein
VLNDALRNITNAEKRGKRQVCYSSTHASRFLIFGSARAAFTCAKPNLVSLVSPLASHPPHPPVLQDGVRIDDANVSVWRIK